ncbi:MAG TPA: hypothetical protein VKD89_02670 [Candidatus Udaeobacter sp.]|nr:hypothetical protein [Candidatus Udaeobacter sp.]
MTVVLTLCISLLLLVQGPTGLAAPDVFAGVVCFMQTSPAIYAAAAVRVAVGIVLLQAASTSRLPIFLRILGGVLTLFVGRQFAEVILAWWSSHGSALVRLFAAISLGLGLVTAYAVAPKPRNA